MPVTRDFEAGLADAAQVLDGIKGDLKKLASSFKKDLTTHETLHGMTWEAIKMMREAEQGTGKVSARDAEKMFKTHGKKLAAQRTTVEEAGKLAANYRKSAEGALVMLKNAVQSAPDKTEAKAAAKDVKTGLKKAVEVAKGIEESATSLPKVPKP